MFIDPPSTAFSGVNLIFVSPGSRTVKKKMTLKVLVGRYQTKVYKDNYKGLQLLYNKTDVLTGSFIEQSYLQVSPILNSIEFSSVALIWL